MVLLVFVRFDGEAIPNPNSAGCGWIVMKDAQALGEGYLCLRVATNNEFKYKRLLNGLLAAKNHRFTIITIQGDLTCDKINRHMLSLNVALFYVIFHLNEISLE